MFFTCKVFKVCVLERTPIKKCHISCRNDVGADEGTDGGKGPLNISAGEQINKSSGFKRLAFGQRYETESDSKVVSDSGHRLSVFRRYPHDILRRLQRMSALIMFGESVEGPEAWKMMRRPSFFCNAMSFDISAIAFAAKI